MDSALICLFGALPGLDSSIMESRHIKAVKEPWCKSNRNNTIKQMITKNCCLSQMAALQVKFACQGMLAYVEVEGITEDNKIGRPNNNFSACQGQIYTLITAAWCMLTIL
jgi:hypothetical protein